ncbi:N-acetyltransferase eso1 [Sporothrix bragantina]|uniref:N-acetyltransferase eso1 n=1 Tax=Sporothrix bragantina TaxID=671064 RepID=A0ABP0BW08_9PEZI
MTPTGLSPVQSTPASSRSGDALTGASLEVEAASKSPSGKSSQRSRFTYRNLADLAAATSTCPLRVIAHIDLDAYYAQCEMRRLGTADDTPLVVQQWRNIIAVNYPARAFGITRMITAIEAKRLCPDLVLQHVPTWKEGESQWAYHDEDSHNAVAQHKVSLEPYRIRSREILATIKETLPAKCAVEKAGIDEVFVDLSAYVHDVLANKLYPDVLAGYKEHYQDEPGTFLPRPPLTEADLDWTGTGSDIIDGQGDDHHLEEGEDAAEGDDRHFVDWDDVAMLEGARIVRAVRQILYDKLQFRCSAGIAANKMLSKLGSSQHKPDKQTVVRPRAVPTFLEGLKSVTKLRGLGGKMGARVVAAFDTESLAELRTLSLAQMQAKLGDQETGFNIYGMVRGIDHSEVTARTEIKSIISAKSFQPPLNTMDQALRWLRVYAAEIKCRLLDEKLSLALLAAVTVGADKDNENEKDDGPPQPAPPAKSAAAQHQLRLPQTIRLHYGVGASNGSGHGHHWRSRQTRIPRDGTPLDEDKLMRLGTQLVEQAQKVDGLFPCAHLAISVDGFEDPIKGNKSIESFFQKAKAATTKPSTSAAASPQTTTPKEADYDEDDFDGNEGLDIAVEDDDSTEMPLSKRRKMDMAPASTDEQGRSIRSLLQHQPRAETPARSVDERLRATLTKDHGRCKTTAAAAGGASAFFRPKNNMDSDGNTSSDTTGLFPCGECGKSFADAVQLQEHEDWHVARVLQAQEKVVLAPPSTSGTTTPTAGAAATTSASRRRGNIPVHSKRGAAPTPPANSISSFFQNQNQSQNQNQNRSPTKNESGNSISSSNKPSGALACPRCGDVFNHPDGLQVHQDWHFAKDLETG